MKRGGVYLGVAPDQNFTYIAALEPKMAFIVDIRRGNLLAHLMYKAIFEMSDDRADFLSMLFSRKRPKDLTAKSTPRSSSPPTRAAEPDEALFNDNLKRISEQLTKTHGFELSEADFSGNGGLNYVYGMFFRYGPDLTYASSGSGGRGGRNNMPTYADLQQATDMEGRNHAYLSDEEHFGILKKLEERNLLVPVVGDFAGPKALRAVGKYLPTMAHGDCVLHVQCRTVPVPERRLAGVLQQCRDLAARRHQRVHPVGAGLQPARSDPQPAHRVQRAADSDLLGRHPPG